MQAANSGEVIRQVARTRSLNSQVIIGQSVPDRHALRLVRALEQHLYLSPNKAPMKRCRQMLSQLDKPCASFLSYARGNGVGQKEGWASPVLASI